jgi:hypothetical protein
MTRGFAAVLIRNRAAVFQQSARARQRQGESGGFALLERWSITFKILIIDVSAPALHYSIIGIR